MAAPPALAPAAKTLPSSPPLSSHAPGDPSSSPCRPPPQRSRPRAGHGGSWARRRRRAAPAWPPPPPSPWPTRRSTACTRPPTPGPMTASSGGALGGGGPGRQGRRCAGPLQRGAHPAGASSGRAPPAAGGSSLWETPGRRALHAGREAARRGNRARAAQPGERWDAAAVQHARPTRAAAAIQLWLRGAAWAGARCSVACTSSLQSAAAATCTSRRRRFRHMQHARTPCPAESLRPCCHPSSFFAAPTTTAPSAADTRSTRRWALHS